MNPMAKVLNIPTTPEAVRAAIARSQGKAVGRAPRVPVLDLGRAPRMIPELGPGQSSAVAGEIRLSLSLPPAALSPNSRACWQAKARAVKKYREEASTISWIATHDDCFSDSYPWSAASIEATFYFRTAARKDADNALASIKAAVDGLADGGIVENDRAFSFSPVKILKDKDNPRLELVIKRTSHA